MNPGLTLLAGLAIDYVWLNDIVCVEKMRGFGGGEVVYDLFEVL